MAEAPAQTPPPRTFAATSLSEADLTTITELLTYLEENAYQYQSHVEVINLLHRGLVSHVYHPTEGDGGPDTAGNPHDYSLLGELRQARKAMDLRFAVGEDLLVDWIQDEVMLARSSEDRVAVTELCQKAIQEEPSSVKLWQAFADWIWLNYSACNNLEGSDQGTWTELDKEVCKDLFTREMFIDILDQAVAATEWCVDESHLLWNRYIEAFLQDLPDSPSSADIQRLDRLFRDRLRTPHLGWEETAQKFWPFVTKYEGDNWEAAMASVTRGSAEAKQQVGLREECELKVKRAIDSGDKTAIYNELSTYLKWEKKNLNRASFNTLTCCALYERALLRFPTNIEWWMDYVDLLTTSKTSTLPVLPALERAVRHCPWSGELWARRLIRCELERKAYSEIEDVKHRATNSGLLDVGGMEEMIKVLAAWCRYLRRHAFDPNSSDDEIDTAEVGITMALEDVQEAGKKLYGDEFEGDPLWRIEEIQTKFLTEARRPEDARSVWKKLVGLQKNSHEFWSKYYAWELYQWGYKRLSDGHRMENPESRPQLATTVVRQAFSWRMSMDWPEKIIELYLGHFQQHELIEELQLAVVEAREATQIIHAKRAKEAAQVAQATAQQQHQGAEVPMEDAVGVGEKRKRGDDTADNTTGAKKTKTEYTAGVSSAVGESSESAAAQTKRDRENNTITVRNLPADVTDLDLRKFFKDSGSVISINILKDERTNTANATVEFELNEDVLTAKTRNGKELNGHEVQIQSGSRCTLYVTNYPPEYDETSLRELFEPIGEVVSVRFPSLKFNNRRRFCYVSFLTPEAAQAAEDALNNKVLDEQHKLVAKIADPDAKKQRSGALTEGREVYYKGMSFEVSEDEIRTFFGQFGDIERLNVLKKVNGQRTGSGFLVFASTDQATAALEAHDKLFHGRILYVEIAGEKKKKFAAASHTHTTTTFVKHETSASPGPSTNAGSPGPETVATNGRRGSTASHASSNAMQIDDQSYKNAKERKVALFNLPDTVNDARVIAVMERYGPLVKVQMRREKEGAILEYKDAKDAFNVKEGVDCSALGAEVASGEVYDLLKKTSKRGFGARGVSVASAAVGGTAGGSTAGSMAMRPAIVQRPGQPGATRGRKRGLGFRRGGYGRAEAGGSEHADDRANGTGAKSNADFRNLFVQSKVSEEEPVTEE